jgi:hypothetical protein
MSGGYEKAIREHAPAAEVCFDPFHVVRLAHDRGQFKLPTGGHLVPRSSGVVVTVWCSGIDRREDAREERKDPGGADRVV